MTNMNMVEVLSAIGPDKGLLLHQKVFDHYGQPFKILGMRQLKDEKYDIDIELKNGEKQTVQV